ncbi:MAG: BON domain-containing protein [Chitinophagaceae bacterium]
MTKRSFFIILTLFIALAVGFTACKKKMKDADIKAAIETALRADPMAVNTSVSVMNGVATITGECKDEASKIHCGEMVKGVKGVKDVINNCTVTPASVPVVNADDEALTRGVTDALKDHPGLKFSLREGKIVLTGEITKAKWTALKQMLDKLKPKGYDLTGVTIK